MAGAKKGKYGKQEGLALREAEEKYLLAQCKAETRRVWIGGIQQHVELGVVLVIAVWVVWGSVVYAVGTGGTLQGLLTMLNENWKGVLLLAGLLFFRTIQEILHRIETFKTPIGDIGHRQVRPADVPEKKPLGKEQS